MYWKVLKVSKLAWMARLTYRYYLCNCSFALPGLLSQSPNQRVNREPQRSSSNGSLCTPSTKCHTAMWSGFRSNSKYHCCKHHRVTICRPRQTRDGGRGKLFATMSYLLGQVVGVILIALVVLGVVKLVRKMRS
jgi:hypothetical protein